MSFSKIILIVIVVSGFLYTTVTANEKCDNCDIPKPEDVCASVTNYWPFDENGNPVQYQGQADSAPNYTATMYYFTALDRDTFVASFDGFTDSNSPYHGATLTLSGLGTLPVLDRFGAENYREGVFWHSGYGQYVFGVDVMTPTPLHYLDCDVKINFKES